MPDNSRESTEELPVRRSALAEAVHVGEQDQARARARLHERLFGEPEDRAFGRYRLIETVGRGGMGTVWRAHDGKLGREVALKLLHEGALRRQLRAKRQLLAEAALMAKLDHPNVVRIYDVGEHEGELYLAMELVRGKTLRRWQQDEERSWEQLLDAYLAAGSGLAAAHRASLVHGDFKPDNVLVGADGRVLVTDFAMTRHIVEARLELELAVGELDTPGDSGGEETHAGSTASGSHAPLVRGTPAYMAPEQFDGQIADARSDQFSFCVALWEALAGRRPFLGRTWGLLREAIERGPEPPERRVGPRALWVALERGLAVDPARRWPALDELLDELRRARQPARRGGALLGVGALLLAGVAMLPGVLAEPPPSRSVTSAPQHCSVEQAQAEMVASWSDTQREAIGAAFRATELPHAEAATTQTLAQLDAWSRAWVEARGVACSASDPEQARLQLVCLDRSRANFAVLVEVLGETNETSVDAAGELIEALPSVDSCASYQLPAADQARSSTELAGREALAQQRDRLEILWTVGRIDEAIVLADTLMREAELRGASDFVAEAQLFRGLLRLDTGEHELALDELLRAALRAREAELVELELEAWLAMADAESRVSGQDADRWLDIAALLLARTSSPELEFDYLTIRGMVARSEGRLDDALEWFERAREFVASFAEARPQRYVKSLYHVAIALIELDEHTRALPLMRESLALAEQIWPAEFPELGVMINGLANVEKHLGDTAGAYADFQRAHARLTKAFGPDHLYVRTVEYQLAICEAELGQCEPARARMDALLELLRDDPNAVWLLPNALAWRAMLCQTLEPNSRAWADEALARASEAFPAGSLQLAKIESHRAWVMLALDDVDAAEQGFARARPTVEAELPEQHLDRLATLAGLGIAWVELGRGEEARPLLEQSLPILDERRPARAAQVRAALDSLGPAGASPTSPVSKP
jgi:tetratricopeptide (TPR) repeat protein